MFDFEYWFGGVVGTCELVASTDVFWRTWVARDVTATSIHSYDELYEQLEGDLHLDECIQHFESRLRAIGALGSVQAFATAVHCLDGFIESHPETRSPEALLLSRQWADFQVAAKKVTELQGAQKFLTRTA